MKWIAFAASLGFWVWLVPSISIALEADYDSDGVEDYADNCSEDWNFDQDDTDGDDCGNVCDADYDNDGFVGLSDFGIFLQLCYGGYTGSVLYEAVCHFEPITDCTCGLSDFGFFVAHYLSVRGPSGTTPGTTACP
jgi:hypothetical protein